MIEASVRALNPLRLEQAGKFGERVKRLGGDFLVFGRGGEVVCKFAAGESRGDENRLGDFARSLFNTGGGKATAEGGGNELLGVGLNIGDKTVAAAVIDTRVADKSIRKRECLLEMLEMFASDFQAEAEVAEQIECISSELSETYEELVLLYKMSTRMKITESHSNYLQMACDSVTELVNVEGIAILLERVVEGEKRLVPTAGSGLIEVDERNSGIVYERLITEIELGKEALLDSEVDSPFKYTWPERMRNIIAVPLYGNDKIAGMMVAANRINKPDFDSIDMKLFTTVANECAVFIENGRLFKELEELFIGSLRALTNSIDAKDDYTRGHSERVAFIARWIAEKLVRQGKLAQEDVHKVYLAGLLHDIGKIGVDESVLRKCGALDEDEVRQIKAHPSIGASILSDIKQMSDIVPGILSHHERPDGKGYPRGLSGTQIPLKGKIVMLADSFDAMTSKRTYRNAMSIEEALAEIEKGLGTQFDKEIGRIFLESDVYQLWSIIQDGTIESYYHNDFAGYGTQAVEALVR